MAASLAQAGRRVVMIDFDLEAPGLDSFEEFAVPKGRTGVVEYVCHYLETGQVAPIKDYVHEIQPVNPADPAKPKPQPLEGNLWLMKEISNGTSKAKFLFSTSHPAYPGISRASIDSDTKV